ncbi:MAG: response regulator [Alphaproteobacteria bacterium]|nr:response regulator [Alphaproteobacteria bacterium]
MTAAPIRLLVVDDEPQIRRFLKTSLTVHGYDVMEADSGSAALRMATTAKPDVMILDLGLPDQDGAEIIKRVREWSKMPIIILSVRGDEAVKVAALDQGADDYVTKPFGMNELLARLRAALRHRLQEQGAEPVFILGTLRVDLARRVVTREGQEVKLSPREYDLLRQLVIHAGKVLTHRHLLREVWGPAHVQDTQYLRVYVGQLRHKLEADPTRPQYLLTEPGVGYRLKVED